MVENPVNLLLKSRALFWEQIASEQHIGRTVAALLLFIVLSSAAYGAILAGWRSPLLSLYVAVKLPLLLVGTTSLVMFLNWLFATFTGSGMTFKQVMAVTYGAMGVACCLLLSLIPVTALFTFFVAGAAGTHDEQRLTHNYLLLTHIILIASAGIAGNAALRQGLKKIVRPGYSPRRIYWSWLVSFTLVGCQLSWILRPFIGSPFFTIEFIRPDALDHNFFEFVFTEVLPYIIKGGS